MLFPQVKLAAKFGAAGVVLFSDPADIANANQFAYPESYWLPGTGVQRGSLLLADGDPLTPGYPSTGKCRTLNGQMIAETGSNPWNILKLNSESLTNLQGDASARIL